MRRRQRQEITTAATLLAVALVLTGCNDDPSPDAGEEPTVTPSQSQAPTPTVLAPKEQAVEDAKAAVVRYYAVLDEIGKDEKVPLKRIEKVAVGSMLTTDYSNMKARRDRGWTQINDLKVTKSRGDSVSLDNSGPEKGIVPNVVVTVCTDVTGVDVVDRKGRSVITDDRPDQNTMTFVVANYSWPKDKRTGWKVQSLKDNQEGTCAL